MGKEDLSEKEAWKEKVEFHVSMSLFKPEFLFFT